MFILISVEEKLLTNLEINSLNSFTTEFIIQYTNITTDIFNINHNILITRLSNNLKNNIILNEKFNPISNKLSAYFLNQNKSL